MLLLLERLVVTASKCGKSLYISKLGSWFVYTWVTITRATKKSLTGWEHASTGFELCPTRPGGSSTIKKSIPV
jgi:hypothetical protein